MGDLVLILNLDNGSSRAVARALRAERIYCRIVPPDLTAGQAEALQPRGLILTGGVDGAVPAAVDPQLLDGRWPVLALGGAAAMLCRAAGGDAQETVFSGSIGKVCFIPCPLTQDLDTCERMLRNARRLRLPEGWRALATCQEEAIGLSHASLPLFGIQFTLEPNDTDGLRLLINFALEVCRCTRWWDFDICIDQAVHELRHQAGGGRAVCAVTGGLSSGVTAMLAHRALGEQLQCVFIDTGLLREGEGDAVISLYRDQLGLRVTRVEAGSRFLQALHGVADPNEKRRVISETLQGILDETLSQLGGDCLVLRSTTANDLLDGRDASRRPGFRSDAPAEPLRELFKDEVGQIGRLLSLPESVLTRPPFPSTGLALRILGEVTPARLQTLRAADRVWDEEVREAGLSRRLRRYFAVLSPMPGDNDHGVIVLRAVQFLDTAQPSFAARLPFELLERVTQRILRERPEIARVVYDLSPSTQATGVEWQ